jgi:signal recognition particle subunit SRP54
VVGLQGSGKTTTAAKLARRFLREGREPMLAACDLVRPAAVEQLTTLAEQVGVPIHAGGPGATRWHGAGGAVEGEGGEAVAS